MNAFFALWMLHAAGAETPPCHQALAAEEASAASIYALPVALVDQRGAAVDLGVGEGHPVLVAMFYGSCTTACPMIVAKIRTIESGLSEAERADLRVVLVSFDPARDTPAALAKLASTHGLDDRWSLLTGDDDAVREVSAVLGVKYKRRQNGDFDHSSPIALLDRQGAVVHRLPDLGAPIEPAVAALAGLRGAPTH